MRGHHTLYNELFGSPGMGAAAVASGYGPSALPPPPPPTPPDTKGTNAATITTTRNRQSANIWSQLQNGDSFLGVKALNLENVRIAEARRERWKFNRAPLEIPVHILAGGKAGSANTNNNRPPPESVGKQAMQLRRKPTAGQWLRSLARQQHRRSVSSLLRTKLLRHHPKHRDRSIRDRNPTKKGRLYPYTTANSPT